LEKSANRRTIQIEPAQSVGRIQAIKLADTTELGELDEKTETWLVEEWEELLFVKSDVKIHAVILGESIYADYPMENFKQDAEEKFQTYNVHLGVFSDQEEAYSWIKEQLLILK